MPACPTKCVIFHSKILNKKGSLVTSGFIKGWARKALAPTTQGRVTQECPEWALLTTFP